MSRHVVYNQREANDIFCKLMLKHALIYFHIGNNHDPFFLNLQKASKFTYINYF